MPVSFQNSFVTAQNSKNTFDRTDAVFATLSVNKGENKRISIVADPFKIRWSLRLVSCYHAFKNLYVIVKVKQSFYFFAKCIVHSANCYGFGLFPLLLSLFRRVPFTIVAV